MNLPTVPYDKSLHVNYGAAIHMMASTVLFAVLVLALRKTNPLMLLAVPILSESVVYVAARYKEIMDNRANAKAVDEGLPPPHSYEIKDQIATLWGGVLVGFPQVVLLLALHVRGG